MGKAKLRIAYDGTEFHGFQKQEGLRTVQGELERALLELLGVPTPAMAASRTDAGVHAIGQVVHVDLPFEPRVPVASWVRALQAYLPRDLSCTDAMWVSDAFDARHSVLWKQYRYTVDTGRVPHVFTRMYATHVPYSLDVPAMNLAATRCLGEHDFTSFCTAYAQQAKKIRTLYSFQIVRGPENLMYFDVVGRSFLHNMVRILVGTMIEVGRGRLSVGALDTILRARDRRMAGPTAPPHGLCLCQIEYPRDVLQTGDRSL